MHLEIIKPESKVFEGEASSVVLPGIDGSLGILNNHAPLITTLRAGTIEVKTAEGKQHSFEVKGGTIEMLNNKLTVLAE
ncbi:MAG: ATP synthase F1 subunit epsilon [Cryomorphaceae bacterium]|nr:MAG: ATP synthase F1 subunit epsilon [Cryomorphaceae bacterium]